MRGFSTGVPRGCGRTRIPKSVPMASLRREAVVKSLTVIAGSRLASILAQALSTELEIVEDDDEEAT